MEFLFQKDPILHNSHINILLVWLWPLTEDSLVYVFIFPKVIYPLNDICLCCSIYTTIAVSYERWFSWQTLTLYKPFYIAYVNSIQMMIIDYVENIIEKQSN